MWFEKPAASAWLGWLLGILSAAFLLLGITTSAWPYLKAGPNVMGGVHGVLQGTISPLDGGGGFGSPAGAYSMRKLKSTYTGPAIRLRRASDNAEQDIGFVGFVPGLGAPVDYVAANVHCAATSCFVRTWYDQAGGIGNANNATPADQPAFIFNCIGTLPCVRVTAANQGLATASSAWVGKGTTSVVANRSAGTGLCSLAVRGANMLQAYSTPNQWWYSDQAVMAYGWPATEGAWHAGVGTMDGAASAARVDSTDVVGTNVPGNAATLASVILGGAAATTCSATEVIFWNNYAVTAAERITLVDNQRGFWGF